jgi:hypothetical protein
VKAKAIASVAPDAVGKLEICRSVKEDFDPALAGSHFPAISLTKVHVVGLDKEPEVFVVA